MGVPSRSRLLATQLRNIELKKQIENYCGYYMVVLQYHGNQHTASLNLKQAFCYEILHRIKENGYRFVTAFGRKDNHKLVEPTHQVIVKKLMNDFYNLKYKKEKATKNDVSEENSHCLIAKVVDI